MKLKDCPNGCNLKILNCQLQNHINEQCIYITCSVC